MALARSTLDAVFPGGSCFCGVVKRRAAPMTPPLKEIIVNRDQLLAAIAMKQHQIAYTEARSKERVRSGAGTKGVQGLLAAGLQQQITGLKADMDTLNEALSRLS